MMATCPKCQLPNPEGVPTCIWCGGHRFAATSGEQPAANAAVPAESSSDVPFAVAPKAAFPLVESFHTPCTMGPDYKPLPSHVGLLLTPKPKGGSMAVEPRTVATHPAAVAAQQAVATRSWSSSAARNFTWNIRFTKAAT
jgi:hypothetical protein